MTRDDVGRVPLAGGFVDLAQGVVELNGRAIRLTTKEREILAYLTEHAGETVTRETLLVRVWDHPAHASPEPVFSVIKRLRAKIDCGAHKHIHAVHGVGYRFERPPTPPITPWEAWVAGIEASIRERLVDTRVVTLLGPPGMGKRSLACRLAGPGGVVRELGMGLDSLARAVQPAVGLVVLVDVPPGAASALAAALDASAPAGQFLVVSQRRLHARDEVAVRMGPLPDEVAAAFLTDSLQHLAVDAPPAAIARIVHDLGGIPRLLRAAAEQASAVGLGALLGELPHPLDALVVRDGWKDFGARARIAADVAALDPIDREALVALSIFEGAFDLEMATSALPPGRSAVAALSALADASVLYADATRAGWFALGAIYRSFAQERLSDLHRERHGTNAMARVRGRIAQIRAGRSDARARLSQDVTELSAAFDRAVAANCGDLGARLAVVLDDLGELRGEPLPARRDRLLRALWLHADRGVSADVRVALAALPPLDDAQALAARDTFAALADRGGVSTAALYLAAAALRFGDVEAARAGLDEVLASPIDARTHLHARAIGAQLEYDHGSVQDAGAAWVEARLLAEELEDAATAAHAWLGLSYALRAAGQHDRCARAISHAERIAADVGTPHLHARTIVARAIESAGRGQSSPVCLHDATIIADELRETALQGAVAAARSDSEICSGNSAAAVKAALTATEAFRADGDVVSLAEATFRLGRAHLVAGDVARAEAAWDESLEIGLRLRSRRLNAAAYSGVGIARLCAGDSDDALSAFDHSVEAATGCGATLLLRRTLRLRALTRISRGEHDLAELDFAECWRLTGDLPAESRPRYEVMARTVGRAFGALRSRAGTIVLSAPLARGGLPEVDYYLCMAMLRIASVSTTHR